jgi:pyrroline-5-carboxylate reductase
METPNIAFIGAGNMGRSLIQGLLADGYPADRMRVAEPNPEQRSRIQGLNPAAISDDNAAAVADAAVVVLAVKPQQMRGVAQQLAPALAGRAPLVVSIAAGIRTVDLERWLGQGAIVRAMPNTPALLKVGATGLYAGGGVTAEQREVAESILRAVGLTVWVDDEGLIDVVTALSGSGPAYFFLLMEVLENAGARLGLSREQSRLLTLQTALGAARMALESDADPATLRAQVTSPGGTTEQALRVMQEQGLAQIVEAAVEAARARGAELAARFGESP